MPGCLFAGNMGVPRGTLAMVNIVSCRRCGRHMVPHIIVGPRICPGRNWTPVPLRSVCPFCAATYAHFYSSIRDLCGRLVVGLALLVLLAIAVRVMAQVELKEHPDRQSGGSSSAVSRKH